jgi:hypothetical protein
LIIGGSNAGKAYLPPDEESYPTVLSEWLNEEFPPKEGAHIVVNLGTGGGGTCLMVSGKWPHT